MLPSEILNAPYDDRLKANKRLLLTTLKSHGFGTAAGEEVILTQVDRITGYLKSRDGPINTREFLHYACANVICGLWFNTQYEFGDPEMTL